MAATDGAAGPISRNFLPGQGGVAVDADDARLPIGQCGRPFRALREKVGTGFSRQQCSKFLDSITFFAFGRFRPNAT
jgi:hypothetical protein